MRPPRRDYGITSTAKPRPRRRARLGGVVVALTVLAAACALEGDPSDSDAGPDDPATFDGDVIDLMLAVDDLDVAEAAGLDASTLDATGAFDLACGEISNDVEAAFALYDDLGLAVGATEYPDAAAAEADLATVSAQPIGCTWTVDGATLELTTITPQERPPARGVELELSTDFGTAPRTILQRENLIVEVSSFGTDGSPVDRLDLAEAVLDEAFGTAE